MAQPNSGFTSMSGYIDRLREEADRKAEEEKRRQEEEARRQSMAAWRRDVPVGPPTQEQAQSMSDLTRGNVGNFSKPADRAQISLPKQQPPQFQVGPTMPGVDTSTPPISNTQTYQPTVGVQPNQSAQQDEPSRQKPAPSISDRTRGNIAPITPATPPSSQGQWNPSLQAPMGTAMAQPPLLANVPAFLEEFGPMVGDAAMDWAQDPFRLGALYDAVQDPSNPANALVNMFGLRVEQREKERQNFTPQPRDFGAIGNIPGALGPLTANQVSQGLSYVNNMFVKGRVYQGLGTALDAFQMLDEAASIIPVAGTDRTVGQYYGMVRDVGDMYNANADPAFLNNVGAIAQVVGGMNPITAPLTNFAFNEENRQFWAVFDPKVWSSISNTATYWDLANKNLVQGLTPTDEQKANNTPEEIAYARAQAVLMAHHGVAAMAEQFDNILDYPVQAKNQQQTADALAQMADQIVDDPLLREHYLSEAGRMGSQAVKLNSTTPLDLYNKNQNAWYSMPFEAIAGLSNAGDWLSLLAPVSPLARRMAQGSKIAGMPQTAKAGIGATIGDMLKDSPILSWLQTNRSKAMIGAYVNYSVMANIMTAVHTKGDITTALTKFIDGTLLEGIPIAQLNGPDAILQASEGILDFGWAGIKDYRAEQARKFLEPLSGWLASAPSLAGEATEIANKNEVAADLLGMLLRSAGQKQNISTMKDIPWGAQVFNVVPQANGKAVVQYTDSLKNVVGQSQEMTLAAAERFAKKTQDAYNKGQEFQTNWARTVGDFERTILSAFTLNSSFSGVLNNTIGGNLTGIMDQGFRYEFIHPLEDQIDWVVTKWGGSFPNARMAEGVGNIDLGNATFGDRILNSGNNPVLNRILNVATLGLNKLGKAARSGDMTAAGGMIKVGEEAVATSLWYTAAKTFIERELPTRFTPAIKAILEESGLTDQNVSNWIVGQVVDAALAGNRVDVTKVFQQIANGKIAPSLYSISPAFHNLFSKEQVFEINKILQDLTPESLGQAKSRIGEVIESARSLVEQEVGKIPVGPGRRFFTDAHDEADVADVVNMLNYAAEQTGRNPEEALQVGERVKNLQTQVNQSIFELLQMAADQPSLGDHIFDLWNQIHHFKDEVRGRVYDFAEQMKGMTKTQPSVGAVRSSEEWDQMFQMTQLQWDDFGRQAMEAIENTRTKILDGSLLKEMTETRANVKAGPLLGGQDFSQMEFTAQELLSDLSIDYDMAMDFMKYNLGFASEDPLWESATKVYRKVTDAFQARVFTALSRFPTQVGFDEFMDAMSDVRAYRRSALGRIKAAQAYLNSDEMTLLKDLVKNKKATKEEVAIVAKAFDGLRAANNGWKTYYKQAWARFDAATRGIVLNGMGDGVFNSLKFTIGDGTEWTLRGPSLKSSKMWEVINADGKRAFMHAGGKAGVPEEIISKFTEIQRMVELEIADQIGGLSLDAAKQAGGFTDEIGSMVQDALGPSGDEAFKEIRRKVQEFMANSSPQLDIRTEYPKWRAEKLGIAENAIYAILQDVAVANAKGHGRMGLGTISKFNKEVLPMLDNILAGAQRYADEMTGISVLDYTREYHPDVLLGLFAPYHFFFTRQSKNALERMLFNPKVSNHVNRFMRTWEAENRADNQPNRNLTSIPGTGVPVGDSVYRINGSLLPRWIPNIGYMTMNGWADPTRANKAFDFVMEQTKEQSFPATAQGHIANIAYLNEYAKNIGLGEYPWWDSAIGAGVGEELDMRGALGDVSPLWRTLGWGSVGVANWMRENNVKYLPEVLEYVQAATLPSYAPYLYGREGSFEANRGNLTDPQAGMVQDIANQEFTGRPPLAEQTPEDLANYQKIKSKVTMEYFVKSVLGYLFSIPIATTSEAEQNLREAKELKSHMDYEPSGNTAGSQAAYYSMTDPESENYVQGLAPFEDQYAVTAESAPQVPDPDVERPGIGVQESLYYDEVAAVKEKYTAEIQATYEANPEWKGTTNKGILGDIKAYNDDVEERLNAELKAIDEKYPSVDKTYGEKTPWSLYGARPSETLEEAQDRLVSQAYANVEKLHPEKGDGSNDDWDVYNAALEEELNRLYNDPTAASDLVFGRALPQREEMPPVPTADILRGTGSPTSAPAATSGATAPVTQAPTPDPNNPYAEQMAAAEQEYGLPAGLLQEVARNESGFDPNAESPAGALGVMQIMPGTWEEWAPKVGVTDILDPDSNIAVSAAYLSWLMNTLPEGQRDIRSVMTAYNWGIGNVLEKGVDAAPPETTAYSNTIASALDAGVNVGAPPAQPQVQQGETFTNPNWGDKIGKWTVVGDPITDTGLTWVSPVPAGTDVYQYYGETDVDGLGNYYASKNQGFGHEGIDWMLPEGTDVGSIAEGTVVFVGDGKDEGRPAYGYMVVVEHPNGMKSRYGHLSGFAVEVGDTVTPGQVVGYVGHTPTTANIGNHLHLSVESPYENTGPYNTIDPFRLIGQGGSVPQVASVSQTQQTGTQTPSVSSATGNNIAFTKTPEQMLNDAKTRGKAPAQVEAAQATSDAFQAVEDRAKAAYPQYAKLYDDYAKLPEEEREAWRAANPMMKALSLAGWNPDEYAYLEKTFGKGVVEKWANIPPYEEGDTGARGDYYRQYPNVFLAKAWIDGRPEPYVEDLNPDPYAEYTRDFGTDYETAKEMFGSNIWDIVTQYYKTPKWVDGAENTEWKAFKKANPQFDKWREWWYELMGNSASTSNFNQYGSSWGGYSGRGGWSGSGFKKEAPYRQVNPIQTPAPGKAPAWRGSDGNGDWRKYLALGDTALRTWRR